MTETTGTCPRCQSQIPQDRLNENLVICSNCGWTNSQNDQAQQGELNQLFIKVSLVFSVILSVAFIHSVNWGNYVFEIIPVKAKYITGLASFKDLKRLEKICRHRQKPNCVEEALNSIVILRPQNLLALSEYGKILKQNQKYAKALDIHKKYFELGGKEPHVAFEYAKLLAFSKNTEEAEKYFRMTLNAKPNTLQITVSQAYVDFLVGSDQLKQAKVFIEAFRRKGINTQFFMDRRLQEIKQQLAQQ